MSWFKPRHTVVRLRPGASVTDPLGNEVPGPVTAENVSVVAVWFGSSDEPGTALHVERIEYDATIYALVGTFSASDKVQIPGFNQTLEVVGNPAEWERGPFGWSPGCEQVNLKVVTG